MESNLILPPSRRLRHLWPVADRLEELQRAARGQRSLSFREFVLQVNPRYQWYWHCEVLARVLQRVADGKLKRLMIFMPPRHGKSELASRLFTAYYLYRHPERWVGVNSYAAELAYALLRAAREHYTRSSKRMRQPLSIGVMLRR